VPLSPQVGDEVEKGKTAEKTLQSAHLRPQLTREKDEDIKKNVANSRGRRWVIGNAGTSHKFEQIVVLGQRKRRQGHHHHQNKLQMVRPSLRRRHFAGAGGPQVAVYGSFLAAC